MADLQPLLPNQSPRKIPQSVFAPIADAPPVADLSGMTPGPNPLGTIASIAPPPLATVGLDPRAALAQKNSDDLANRKSAALADYDRRSNPVKPTTTLGKIGHVAANIGNVLGDIFAPSTMALIPGTQLNNEVEKNRDLGVVDQVSKLQSEDEQRQQNAALTQANINDKALVTITPEMASSIGNDSLAGTMVTQQALQRMVTNAGTNSARRDVATTNANARTSAAQIEANARANIASLKPEQRDDRAIRILSTPEAERTPDDIAYLRGYNQWVQQTKVNPGVARAEAYAQWRPVQVVDPTTGNTYYASAATAINTHAPGTSSIPFRTASAMARYMTSGKGGATMTAYRTATDHLDLLGKAADALQNGDIPAFNRIGNAIAQETGNPAPTNFDSIKSMLTGELANVAKASGATDSEIGTLRDQISRASSPEQFSGIIQTEQDLMDQKASEMFEQYQAGMQGVPVTTRGGMNPARRTPLTNHGGNSSTPANGGGANKGVFDSARWAKANPKGDVNAAKAYAKSQGYEVK